MVPSSASRDCLFARAKWAFTTRRVDRAAVHGLDPAVSAAQPGDLVLGRITEVGQHRKVQLASGRSSQSYLDDLIVAACGSRYAPDQFEGVAELHPDAADLLAGGGVLGRMVQSHVKMLPPTQVRPVGLLTRACGGVVNLRDYALPMPETPPDIPVLAVVGASMNSGKTTTAVSLAHGLMRAGLRVAGIKATGTGAFGDYNAFLDAGVPIVADFTDAGMASTYGEPLQRIVDGLDRLLHHAAGSDADIAVVEFADGIFQAETQGLLALPAIRERISELLYAAPDAVGAIGGILALRGSGYQPVAVSGKVSLSPLAVREAETRAGVPILTREDLHDETEALARFGHVVDRPAAEPFGRSGAEAA